MDKTIGFIGGGNMASAMIGGILKSGLAAKEQIIIDALKHYRMLDPSVEMTTNSEVVTNES